MHSLYCSAENYLRGAATGRASEQINESSTERDGHTSISSVYFRNVLHTRRRKCNVSLMCLHYAAVYRYLDACVKAFYEMKRWKDTFTQLPCINEHLWSTTHHNVEQYFFFFKYAKIYMFLATTGSSVKWLGKIIFFEMVGLM